MSVGTVAPAHRHALLYEDDADLPEHGLAYAGIGLPVVVVAARGATGASSTSRLRTLGLVLAEDPAPGVMVVMIVTVVKAVVVAGVTVTLRKLLQSMRRAC